MVTTGGTGNIRYIGQWENGDGRGPLKKKRIERWLGLVVFSSGEGMNACDGIVGDGEWPPVSAGDAAAGLERKEEETRL